MATKLPRAARAAGAFVALLTLTSGACGRAPDENDAAPARPGAAPGTPVRPEPEPAEQEPEPAPAGDWTASAIRSEHDVTGVATLRSVRTARHAGFERIVFEFDGAGLPSYRVEYVDPPVRECGSGHTVELPGGAWLAIRFEPARAHDDDGRATIADRDRSPGYPLLLRLRTICDFEAHLDWIAAASSAAPFAVMELDAPARLVVDLRAP